VITRQPVRYNSMSECCSHGRTLRPTVRFMASTTGFVIVPIPTDVIDRARSTARSASETPVVSLSAAGGEPLRCCLRNARPGEPMILFNHEPLLPNSPYQERGAVFAHATSCHPALNPHEYPPDWRGRPQVLRAYDHRGWIHTALVHDGSSPEAAISTAFEDPEIVEIHSRNVAYGCFMFSLRRTCS
jgi:hypothetical protein